ncbi:L-lysine cyclodeaminase [Clostridium acetireducens DSM 10703]|uniref:L-lysine cyclodeaminase n=1 Tax=Clostridium acetireducens DSM 10703 TaxID=1121290 RepID=A0A1E8EVM5_9CLOT|nr:ornithine cyclodeaminase family protein [Clostridium acetireducens]OFH99456.1 L-lysine cyclodeaminase [Clostridium acetireducens DSM 10703]
MLFLSKEDIKNVIDFKEMVEVIEKSMLIYEEGNYVMPDRISVLNEDETYLYMPCFCGDIKGTKFLTLYPENRKHGEAVIQGVMVMNSPKTGKVDCVMDGAAITSFRTGAVGAMGIKYTTPESVETLGVIGTGVQGFSQCLYACTMRNIKKIHVFDIAKERAEKFKKDLEDELKNVEVVVCENTEDLVKKSELIITVTTSPKPVMPDDVELFKGKHFIGIGSYKPHMREYPKAIFENLKSVYIDVEFAKEETGDLATPLKEGWIKDEQIHSIGKLIKDKSILEEETTFFKSVGMALFDTTIANYVLRKAKEKKIGKEVKF